MVTSEVRTILVVAAERYELRPVRPREGEHWILTANGPGPVLAGQAVDGIDGEGIARLEAIVSIGLCGALRAELQVGDIVVASSVNGRAADRFEWRSAGFRVAVGDVASIDHVAQTVDEKRRLRETGAVAVEMEAAAVLERARRLGVPFYCVKAVSDTAEEGFTLDFNAARDRAGRFSVRRVLLQALRRPRAGASELVRLRRNSEIALKALGEFIGNCSF